MPSCDYCGEAEAERTCSYCGFRHCWDHYFPERHDCIGISRGETHGPEFRIKNREMVATRGGGHCRGCGKAIKAERKWCFQCAVEKADDSDETTPEEVRHTAGTHDCLECGRATGITNERCFICRQSGKSSAGEEQEQDDRERGFWIIGLGIVRTVVRVLKRGRSRVRAKWWRIKRSVKRRRRPRYRSRWKRARYGIISSLYATLKLGLILIVFALIIFAGAQFLLGGANAPSVSVANTSLNTSNISVGSGQHETETLNKSKVRSQFIQIYNNERAGENLQPVSYWGELTELGQAHAKNMKEYDYIGHDQPDGGDIEARFESYGLLSTCNLDIPNSNRYYPGAENAAGAVWQDRLIRPWNGSTTTINTERDLAKYLVNSWMSSPPHRKPMFLPDVRRIGLGIAVSEDGSVYAALEMCS